MSSRAPIQAASQLPGPELGESDVTDDETASREGGPDRLFSNTLANSLGLVVSYLFSFLLAPIMLRGLGLEQFGLWAVSGALATYAGLADFGVTRSLFRFVALYDAQGDTHRIRQSLGLGLAVVAALGLVLGVLAVAFAPLFVAAFGGIKTSDARIVLLCSVSIFTANGLAQALGSVPTGLRRMLAPNIGQSVGATINFAFSVLALIVHPTLTFYAAANAAAAWLGVLAMLVAVVRVCPGLRPALPSRALSREIVHFGMRSQVTTLSSLIDLQSDKIVIALLVSVEAAAAYEIAARLVAAVRAVTVLTVSAMIPAMTVRLAKRGTQNLRHLYVIYTRKSTALAAPIFVAACLSARYLFPAWLGRTPPHSVGILLALNLAHFVAVTTGVGSSIAMADGKPGIAARAASVGTVLNVLLTLILGPIVGLSGVMAGTVAALALGSALFFRSFHQTYRLRLADLVDGLRGPVGLALVVALPFAVTAAVVSVPADRASAAVLTFALGAGYVLCYLVPALRLNMLPETVTNWVSLRAPGWLTSTSVAP